MPLRLRTAGFLGALIVIGCGDARPAKEPAPATVKNPVTEANLTSVTLSADAARRLGIATAPVESTTVAPSRTLGGEVVVPPGGALVVTAPVAGVVMVPLGGGIPRAGVRVNAGQPLLRLVALPPDRDILRSEPELATAEARLAQARAEAARVAALYADRLVAAREDERARADLAAARAAYEAAAGQASLVRRGVPADARGLSPLTINAPGAGVVRGLSVAAGQAVAAGAPLAEIVQVDRLWIRVAVYAGEVSRVARSAEATVHGLGGYGGGPLATALPITGPPTADPTSASVDLYYELRGGTALRPGERVGVTIPLLNGAARALVVPLAALVRDMSGGTWVYERTTPVTFVRRRVEVSRVVGGRAVLAMGPAPGTLVVTAGAAELFGTEFGAGK